MRFATAPCDVVFAALASALTQSGAARFRRFTGANIGNRLAVVLDNQIRSVATIQSEISDSGRITGQSSQQEASDLALVLRAGSLPAGIVYLEERSIGPSLGADSIHQGLVAGLAGLIAVVSFMLVYYRRSGVNATVALILNAVMLLAALSWPLWPPAPHTPGAPKPMCIEPRCM